MADHTLEGRRVLVVEDDYLVALDICGHLEDAGAKVIGPMASVGKALAMIEMTPHIDVAMLDVNVRGEQVFPVADRLAERQVPIVFTTGYDKSAMPAGYRHIPRCEKPVNMIAMIDLINHAIRP